MFDKVFAITITIKVHAHKKEGEPLMKNLKQLSIPLIISILFLLAACGSAGSSAADNELTGDPELGQIVFQQYCSECHSTTEGQVIEGPPLFEAGTRLDYDYVKESILDPTAHDAYYEDLYTESGTTMPTDFGQLLSDRQLEDVIAYVMSLK
jgi:nitric oxide reductase subunit C